jgi:purine-binding chemotaxis protein CheW
MRRGNEAVSETQIVAFKLEEEEFAVNIHQVREVLKMVPVTPLPQSAHFIEGVINLRSEHPCIFFLHQASVQER